MVIYKTTFTLWRFTKRMHKLKIMDGWTRKFESICMNSKNISTKAQPLIHVTRMRSLNIPNLNKSNFFYEWHVLTQPHTSLWSLMCSNPPWVNLIYSQFTIAFEMLAQNFIRCHHHFQFLFHHDAICFHDFNTNWKLDNAPSGDAWRKKKTTKNIKNSRKRKN
jgi:hypothetical protein